MTESYKKALKEAREELALIPTLRGLLSTRETQLKQIIEGLEAICEHAEEGSLYDTAFTNPLAFFDAVARGYEPGLQESVAAILSNHAPNVLAPTAVRDELERIGVNTKNYRNPMATIHRALGRLAIDPKSKIQAVIKEGKTVGYKYAGVPPEPVGMAELIKRFAPPKKNPLRELAEKEAKKKS